MRREEQGPEDRQALAARIRDGDVAAFDAFIREQWASIVRYASCFLYSVDDAKDVSQEAFVRMWEQRSGLRTDGSIRAYLFQIARSIAINEGKARDLHGRLEARQADETRGVRTPADELDAKELRAMVERAIESLPQRRREAFVLAHLHGLPQREIAEVMGIAPQTVANQVSAALADLRVMLAACRTEGGDEDVLQSGMKR